MAEFTSEDGKLYIDGKEVLRGWESYNGLYWFAIEKSHRQTSLIKGKEYEADQIYFGYAQGQCEEYGYFSETELKLLKPKIWEIPKSNLPWSGRRYN